MPIALFAFVAALAFAAGAVRVGLIPDDAVALWAAAITAGDGELSIGSIVAAYPSIPFLATTLLHFIMPNGTPTPALLAAGIFAVLAGVWFHALRLSGLSVITAGLATLLVAFHPMLLRAVISGAAEMFLVIFLYLFGNALYDLRARSGIPEVMTVGLALLGVAFSHPMGAAIAAAAVPLLVFAISPTLVAGSAINVVLTLAFPTLFGAAAFAYVAWIFPGDGWRFFAETPASMAEWTASHARLIPGGLAGAPALDAGLTVAVVLAMAAPIAVVAIGWVYRRRALIAPAAVFAMAAIAAAIFAIVTGLFGSPGIATIAAPVLAVIVMTRVPIDRHRRGLALMLLVLGWLGGAIGLAIVDPIATTRASAAIEGQFGDQERIDALGLGGATVGRDDVLVDTFNAPAVVLGRGHARGLLLPSGEPFALALLFSRIDAPFVAVPNPQSNLGAGDRLNRTFPFLFRQGLPGYRVIYQNNTWRLFADERIQAFKQQ
jgi:hypothetical protein